MTKACKPRRVIAYRGSFVSDDAKTTYETSLSIQYLCCECFVKIYVPYRKYMYPIGNTCALMEIYKPLPCLAHDLIPLNIWIGGKCQTFGFQSSSESCSLFVRSCLLLTAHLTRSHFCAVAQQPQKKNPKHPKFITTFASQIPYHPILPTSQSTTMGLVSVATMVVALRKVVDGDCRLSEASSLWKLAARRPCWAPPAHRPPLHHPSSPSCNTTPTLTFFRIVVYCFPDFV